jgi:hypothetical protein
VPSGLHLLLAAEAGSDVLVERLARDSIDAFDINLDLVSNVVAITKVDPHRL